MPPSPGQGQFHGLHAEVGGQPAVAGRRNTAALKVTEDDDAGFIARAFLNGRGDLVADAAQTLLSALARVGHEDPALQNTAFQAGWQVLDLPRDTRSLLELSQCNISSIDAALDRLNRGSAPVKKRSRR